MNPLHHTVSLRAKQRCEYCHAPERFFNFAFEVEHIVPRVQGGSNGLSNLALACNSCNSFKSVFIMGIDPETQTETLLFNPRRDDWDEHFAFDDGTGILKGLTSTGRATIQRLRLNSDFQVSARLLWMSAGYYP